MKVRYLLSLATVATLGLGLVSCAAPEAPADDAEMEETAPEEESMTDEEPMKKTLKPWTKAKKWKKVKP